MASWRKNYLINDNRTNTKMSKVSKNRPSVRNSGSDDSLNIVNRPSIFAIGKDADQNGDLELVNFGYKVRDRPGSWSNHPSVYGIGKDADEFTGRWEYINMGFDLSDIANESSVSYHLPSGVQHGTRGLEVTNAWSDSGTLRDKSSLVKQSTMSQNKSLLSNGRNTIETDNNLDMQTGNKNEEREMWGKKIEFLLAIIGFAIDLGNVWRFPFICFKNGGGAFLIPYFIMLIFIGVPLFYMELALGQYHRSGPISIWLHICPIFCGIGYGVCFVATYVGSYYNTVIAWSMYYLIASFRPEVPWKTCNNTWNTPSCVSLLDERNITNTSSSPAEEYFLREVLEFHRSTGIDDIGNVKWSLCLCLLSVFVIIYFCLWKGIKSSGKAVWVTAILPFIILFALLVRGVTLPGAETGMLYYIRPDFSRIARVEVWLDAAAQVFFSLGPGFGTLIALSSYNKFDNNCYFDAIITSIINCCTSLLAGLVVFSIIGYMALKQGKNIEDVAIMGPGLVFIVYPEAISTIPLSSFWSILFFTMLITLGLDSSFGGLEAVITAISDAYPKLKKRRELLVVVILMYCFFLGLPTTTYGGQYVMQIMDTHGASVALIFICLMEVVALNWFYGVRRFSDDVSCMLGSPPGIFWKICWSVISPLGLLTLFILSIVSYSGIQLDGYIFPQWCQYVGWAITFSSILCIPTFMVYKVLSTKGSIKQKIISSIQPSVLSPHLRNQTDIKLEKFSKI